MIPEIKFSHWYWKFGCEPLDTPCWVLSISRVKISELPESFLGWDTAYVDGQNILHYPLNFEDGLLIVIFNPFMDDVFTTIRRWTPEKERYYRGLVGKEVKITITEER